MPLLCHSIGLAVSPRPVRGHGKYRVPSTQYPVLQYSVSTRYSVLGTRLLGTQYSVLSTQYSVLSTRYSPRSPHGARLNGDARQSTGDSSSGFVEILIRADDGGED